MRKLHAEGTLNGVTGHLTRVTNNLDRNKDRLYAYDTLGRLYVARGGRGVGGSTATMAGVTANWHQGYWYENNNRLTRNSSGVTADGKDVPFKGGTNWTYDGNTNRITSANHEYDNGGNMVRGKAPDGTIQRYEYDEAGRMVKIKTDAGTLLEEYGYGRSRERVKKRRQDGTKVYYAWGGSSVLAEYEEGASATVLSWKKSYIYAGSRLLSTITKNGNTETTEYHHPDRLGTKLITNPATNTAKEQGTLPYGTSLDAETTTPQANNGVGPSNQRFTSYDRSGTTGLDYAVNRIYSSEQARFLQPDPIGMASADLTDPQSLNMYSYARNNPIDFVDPSGTHPRYTKYFLDGIEISEEMGLQMLESEAVEPSGGYSGPLGFWVDFNDWSKTDEYGFPGTGTSFIVNKSYVSKLLRESRSKPIFPVHQKEEEVGGGLGEQDGYSKSKPKGDWRVRALVRGGAPKAKAAMPVLNVIGTVMSLFTLPVAAVGSGAASSLVAKGAGQEVAKVSSFGQKLFLSEKFGITSTKFGNSAAFAKGTMNQGGNLFKAGWSTGTNSAGKWGYKFRIGIGSSSANPNIARFHIYIPKSFVPNSFANPSIQVKRSLFKLGLKP